MRTQEEIKEKLEDLKEFLENTNLFYGGFSHSSYDDITNKIKENEGTFNIIKEIKDKSTDEIFKILKEKNDYYDTVPKTEDRKIHEIQGEILGLRWMLH